MMKVKRYGREVDQKEHILACHMQLHVPILVDHDMSCKQELEKAKALAK
jgi:hypothetical protein